MPLFNYQCVKCCNIVEKFLHNINDEIEIKCEECGETEFTRIFGNIYNRIRLNAKDTLDKKIMPDVDNIMNKISKGNDNDFLDIAGE